MVGTDSFKSYRLLVLTLSGVHLSFLPSDIDAAVAMSKYVYSSPGSVLRAIGLVMSFIPVLVILILLGSEKDSIVHEFILTNTSNSQVDGDEEKDGNYYYFRKESSESISKKSGTADKKKARMSMHPQAMVKFSDDLEEAIPNPLKMVTKNSNDSITSSPNITASQIASRSSSKAAPMKPVKAVVKSNLAFVDKGSVLSVSKQRESTFGLESTYSIATLPDNEYDNAGENYLISPSQLANSSHLTNYM